MTGSISAFRDDALGEGDATEVARRIAAGEITAQQASDAADSRIEAVNSQLDALAFRPDRAEPAIEIDTDESPLRGVPILIKDNIEVRGWPTGHGSDAFRAPVAAADGNVAARFRELGATFMGKSTLPEFGFNASTEWVGGRATRNPWNPAYSAGASSGGSAALVAAGAVPIAHANDGGGSIRIPAAACGLVGLKPSRGRVPVERMNETLPIKIISDGVVSRSVRDVAGYFSALERLCPAVDLPPIGTVDRPNARRLRIGVYTANLVTGGRADRETVAAVEDVSRLLADLGHEVAEVQPPTRDNFVDDFTLYWGFLGFSMVTAGKKLIAPDFQATALDPLTLGLSKHFRHHAWKAPAAFLRLKHSADVYNRAFSAVDVILSPTVSRTTPPLGYLGPDQPFEQQIGRLIAYAAYTPLQNAAGSPGISLPLGCSEIGLPIGVHFGAATGDERTLLELALELEEARPFTSLKP